MVQSAQFQASWRELERSPKNARLPLILRCVQCRSPFAWYAQELTILTDALTVHGRPASFGDLDYNFHVILHGDVVCTHCGAPDDVLMESTSVYALMKTLPGLSSPPSGLHLGNNGSVDGRQMPLSELLAEIQDALVRDPENVRQRIRLGNVFKRLKQSSRAASAFHAAMMSDPTAVEALATLGKLSLDRRDITTASTFLRAAAALIIRSEAHYYLDPKEEVQQGVTTYLCILRREPGWGPEDEQLFQKMQAISGLTLFDEHHPGDAARLRGGRQSANAARGASGFPAGYRHRVLGRNDPCRCGSGRKYRKCCGKQ